MNDTLLPYTVLLLRPDWQHDGHQSDWVAREHVTARDPDRAFELAIAARILEEPDLKTTDLAVLAVYAGHLHDLFQP